jgi:hypothetical protein
MCSWMDVAAASYDFRTTPYRRTFECCYTVVILLYGMVSVKNVVNFFFVADMIDTWQNKNADGSLHSMT